MSRKFTILAFMVAIAIWLANSANPPNGNTGSPVDGTCMNCHTLNGGTQDGIITIAGLPATITANQAYVLTLTNANPNGVGAEAGFQMSILNSSNLQAGTFSGASGGSTIQTFMGRQYWEHNPSQVYPANNEVSWTVTWTAPSSPNGTTITAYAAGNIANGNNQTSGDLIILQESAGVLQGGPALVVSIDTWNDVSCFGGNNGSATVTVSGGAPPYSYNWSNGGNTATINNIGAGTYTVTVTDNAGSTGTDNVVIVQPPNLVLQTPAITHVSCNGDNDGAIAASATGGTPPYDWDWSNGGTTATINNLVAGTYTVTITDDNGCTKTASYNVTQPQPVDISLVSLNDESCAGEEDGSITISASGGSAPLFAEWSNGAIGNSISDLEPGTYAVTVTDNNDCTATETYVIDPGGVVEVDLVNLTHVTCNGGSNGSISVNATGGEAPYTYSWSNGGSGATITNLTAGNYLLTTTDNNGCELVTLYMINQPAAMLVSIAQVGSVLCNGNATVDLTASVTNGLPPYSGLWSNGATGLTLNDVGAGTYSITITDSGGCTSTASTTVSQPDLLVVSVATTDETNAGANDGTATATANGGTGTVTYLWSNGGNTASITGLAPGTYTVTVTDANGCTSTATGQVDAFGCSLDVNVSSAFTICEGESLFIQPTVTGATGIVTYLWSTGDTTESLTVNQPGNYCVSVSDEAACQDADCIEVSFFPAPTLLCTVMNESIPGAGDGAAGCDTIPGFLYAWSNGATTAGITGLVPGEYCVTLTDVGNGCTYEECFTVQPGNCQLIITSIITDNTCNGDATGNVDVNVSNATVPVTFQWSNGDMDASLNNVSAGTYTVTIADAAGCVEVREYIVSQPEPLIITVDSIMLVSDFPDGAVFITVTGGTSPYAYDWSNEAGDTSSQEDFINIFPGNAEVIVTDANGCVASLDSILVEVIIATKDVKYNPLKVYPVPVDNMLFVDLDKNIEEVIVTAIDGRTVMQSKNIHANRIDVSHIEAGWYLIRIFDGEQWYIARIVK